MFTTIITILYIAAGIISVAACIPQINRLMKIKNSDSFSLTTWLMWTSTQVITLLYVIHISAILMVLTNIVWVTFYGTMSSLIVYYRYKQVRLIGGRVSAPVPVHDSEI